jgi:hypothetical protein
MRGKNQFGVDAQFRRDRSRSLLGALCFSNHTPKRSPLTQDRLQRRKAGVPTDDSTRKNSSISVPKPVIKSCAPVSDTSTKRHSRHHVPSIAINLTLMAGSKRIRILFFRRSIRIAINFLSWRTQARLEQGYCQPGRLTIAFLLVILLALLVVLACSKACSASRSCRSQAISALFAVTYRGVTSSKTAMSSSESSWP